MDKDKKPTSFLEKIPSKEKKAIFEEISTNYDSNIDYFKDKNLYKNQKGKVYLTHINIEELNIERINGFGIYFGTIHDSGRFRLSIEGTQLINVKQNYVVLKEEKFSNYLAAENLFPEDLEVINREENCPFLIVKFNNDNLGCVTIKEDNVQNYIAKSRKLDYNKVF